MGWFHDGHRSLMERACAENATTIATIFVNPRQFNEAADYQRYPRNEARDLAICAEEGLDLVFAPPVEEVYPEGFDTAVSVERGAAAGGRRASRPLRRGRHRRRHPVQPRRRRSAYFGQKDAQQVMVIGQMARDLAIPTEVIACPTVRERDGLALSSRNVHLAPDERGGAGPATALLAADGAWRPASDPAMRSAM